MHAPFRRLESAERPEPEALCEICQRLRPPFAKAAAYGLYEDHLRALIHLLKYERVTAVARPLGALLAQIMLNMMHTIPDLPPECIVIAVPLHPLKERQRGYNQTVLLAEAAMRVLRREQKTHSFHLARHVLERHRTTESQSGLDARTRRRNLRGAFSVTHAKAIAGRTVWLLDDIYTTGATARECARTLLAAGAERAFVATLARSQREGVAFWDATPTREPAREKGLQEM